MGFSKTFKFDDKQNLVAEFCGLLSHPARIMILESLISSKKGLKAAEIVAQVPLSTTTVMQHIQKLKLANVIEKNTSPEADDYVRWIVNQEKLDEYIAAMDNFKLRILA